jgi:undecaprenyl-diphosphatase
MILEQIVLGIVQGIAEWLPISSEGFLVLIKTNFFNSGLTLTTLIGYSMFLHLGTFLAALIYFWKDVIKLIKTIFNYKQETKENQQVLKFLIWTTIISGIIGYLILLAIKGVEDSFLSTGKSITLLVGSMLLVTGILQLRIKEEGLNKAKDLRLLDYLILGISQGLTIIPGISRSGMTMSMLLLRRFDKEFALKLSILMSLPVVLGANIILGFGDALFTLYGLLGLLFSFLFGLLTIHLLLKLAKKINFAYFVLFFAFLSIIAFFI